MTKKSSKVDVYTLHFMHAYIHSASKCMEFYRNAQAFTDEKCWIMDLEASSPSPFHACGIVYSHGHTEKA